MAVLIGFPQRSPSILPWEGPCEATLATKMTFVGKWEGGRIALLSGDRRRWEGRQMSLSTWRDDRGAMARLIAFQDDPAGFMERWRDKKRRERGLYTTRSFCGQSTST